MTIDGIYEIFYIKVSGTYFPVACLTENGMEETSETIGTTTRQNSNGWTTLKATSQSYSIPISGVVKYNADATEISYRNLQSYKRNRSVFEWKIENGAGDDIDYGNGLITSLSRTNAINNEIAFNATVQGYGEPLIAAGSIVYEYNVYEDDVYE
jgi:predicted secreted protein